MEEESQQPVIKTIVRNNKRKVGGDVNIIDEQKQPQQQHFNKVILTLPDNCTIHNIILDGKTGIEQLKNVDIEDLTMLSSVLDIGSKIIAKGEEMGLYIVDNVQTFESIKLRDYIVLLTFPLKCKLTKQNILAIEDINESRIGANGWETGIEEKSNRLYLKLTISSHKNPYYIEESHYIHKTIKRSLIHTLYENDLEHHGESVKRKKTTNNNKDDKK